MEKGKINLANKTWPVQKKLASFCKHLFCNFCFEKLNLCVLFLFLFRATKFISAAYKWQINWLEATQAFFVSFERQKFRSG